jgi:hypothetical protein
VREDVIQAAKRIAREDLGIGLRSQELAGMYDVTWHYSDVSVKRLHLVYSAITEDPECSPRTGLEARFFREFRKGDLEGAIVIDALNDCSKK